MNEEKLTQLREEQTELPQWVTPVYIGTCVLVAAVNLSWLFLHVPYVLFAVLSLATWVLPFVLYGLFPDYFTLLDNSRRSKKKSFDLVSLLSGCAITLRTLTDYPNILQWGKFMIAAGVFVAVFTAVMMIFTNQWRKKKTIIFVIAMIGLFSAFGIVGQLNCTFDPSQPQSCTAVVSELSVSTSDEGKDTYHVDVKLPDGTELSLEVDQSRYNSLQQGQTVEIAVYSGMLGVPYAFVP